MSWLRNRQRPSEPAAWEGPFAPPAPTGQARFHPMLRTAAELTGHPDQDQVPATSADPAATPGAPAAA
jgi:hypothetical protein